ncbi:MAG: hypothetical protein ACI843_003046, partial [Psychrobacter glaciei]
VGPRDFTLRVTEASPAGKFSQPVGTEKTLPVLSLRLLSDLVIKKLRVSVGIHYFHGFFDSIFRLNISLTNCHQK